MRLRLGDLRTMLHEASKKESIEPYEAVNHVLAHLEKFFPGVSKRNLPPLIHPETGEGLEDAVPFPPKLLAYLKKIDMDPSEFWDGWDYIQNPEDTLTSWDFNTAPRSEEVGDALRASAAYIDHGVNAPGTRGKKPN